MYSNTWNMMPFLEALRSAPGHYALFEAIRYKRHRQALLLTEAGVDVNCRNGRGLTPLIYTVTQISDDKNSAKFTKLLLDAGADPNITDWDGMTPLMHACRLGLAEAVRHLLENKRTNINIGDPDGNTALIHAAMNGHDNVISMFIVQYKQNISALNLNQKNNQGLSALQIALSNGHDHCAKLLTRDAQFFPSTITEFPDPKVLDRDPTPIENKLACPEIHCFSPKKAVKRPIQTSVERRSTKNVGINCNNGLSEIHFDSSIPVGDFRNSETRADYSLITKMQNKSTQTLILKNRLNTSKPTSKILEPINGLESVFIQHLSIQSKKSPELLTPRNNSGYVNSWRCADSNFLLGNLNKRPDSEPNLLPVMPSPSPLPPVKKTVHSSLSRRDLISNSSYHPDLCAANSELLKKNICVNSS